MRKYLLRFESPPTVGPEDLEEAIAYFKEGLGQIEHFVGDRHYRVSLVDIQQLPREAGGDTVIHHNDPVTPLEDLHHAVGDPPSGEL